MKCLRSGQLCIFQGRLSHGGGGGDIDGYLNSIGVEQGVSYRSWPSFPDSECKHRCQLAPDING